MPQFTPEQIASLEAPLNRAVVKKNPKGFDYVEGWHAIAEANRIFGFDGWGRELSSLVQVAPAYQVGDKWRVAYRATVRITVGSIVRDGTGYGSGIGKDLNDAHESAVKEAETDAMKRALMTFGNPFGLALYDKEQTNVQTMPEPESGALTMAKGLLLSARSKNEFTEIWNANKAGWKGVMADADYRAIVKTMHDEAQRWATLAGEPAAFAHATEDAPHLNGRAAA